MKKTFLLLICVSMILSNQFVNAASISDVKKEAGFISLNNSTTKEVEPDIATITFAVENTSDTAQKASSENNILSNEIINSLKLIVDANTDIIKTTNFSVRPIYYTTVSGKRAIRNYMAVNSVTVTTKDTSKVAKLIDTAIAKGANRTSNLHYGIEDSKQMCNSLYPELVKDLKSQASVLATAAGTTLNGLKYLNATCNSDTISSNGRFYAAKNAMSDSSVESATPTPVEAGKVKIRVHVNADFYVK